LNVVALLGPKTTQEIIAERINDALETLSRVGVSVPVARALAQHVIGAEIAAHECQNALLS
jgi:hypothetical protein